MVEDAFIVEPWCVREPRLRVDELSTAESIFTLANGGLGIRGCLDEGEPVGTSGTYLNGVHELRSLVYPETGSGDPEATETLVNTINGTLIRVLVDGQPLDVRQGELLQHERLLDFRRGTLRRRLRWRCPGGREVEVISERVVSLDQRMTAAVRYRVQALDQPVEIVLQSSLAANEQLPRLPAVPDPEELLAHPLEGLEHQAAGARLTLLHRTATTGLIVGATAEHVIDSSADVEEHVESQPDHARYSASVRLEPGGHLTVVKLLGYAWSGDRDLPAVRDELAGALTVARRRGWDGLLAAQRVFLDNFWDSADVELDGDPELQQAVRFALFQLLQATVRADGRGIAGKALTGTGYEGHVFWDTETFVLQVMTAVAPSVVRHALRWRHSTLPKARERARQFDLQGAAFPWRTITGAECSGYWPAGSAAFHVNADIADAVVRYVDATEDEEFASSYGLELLAETARLWLSLGHWGRDERFHIFGVTGPDEYSALGDDNVYTNLMAQRNLHAAAHWAEQLPADAARLEITEGERAQWRAAADAMFVPYDEGLGVHPQAAGYLDQPRWDFAAMAEDSYPLHSHFPYFQLYRKQVVKQADLVLALFLRGDAFDDEQKARDFAYYEEITVRDSSLSAPCQAIIAAEVGHLDLAHEYIVESALADMRDEEHDSSNGMHIAALAGTWLALVAGFGGLRQTDGGLSFRPTLPAALSRLRFRLLFRGRLLRVTVEPGTATYELLRGAPISIRHERETVEVSGEQAVSRPLSPRPRRPVPIQPETRAPGRGTPLDEATPAAPGHSVAEPVGPRLASYDDDR
ncbi:MAG TPA: glycosyl hydrolase family 65 protein [Actinophytocola sp.]|nr:glycosyl hydrolase family 65 protein [Actinophytocola sp.]